MTSAPRPGRRTDLEQVPHGHTAQRLTWRFLPPRLRSEVERRLGSPVVAAESKDAGFSSGFASVLRTGDGRSVFLKAASVIAQADIAASYRTEARVLAGLVRHGGVPMPRPLWVIDDDVWVALGFEAVAGRPPRRPWRGRELERSLDLLEEVAGATSEVPALPLRPTLELHPSLAHGWDSVPDRPHRAEAQELARAYAALPATDFCHTDVRDDNVLLLDDGTALLVDWSQGSLGQRWRDTVDLLVSAWGDGADADAVLARRRLTRDVDPSHVDGWLAALGGFMADASYRPAPPASPYLRVHTRWYAEALWGWLSERRGWA